MSSNIAVSRREWKLVEELINSCCIVICMNYIVFITSCRQLSTYWINREILNKSEVVSVIFTICCSFKKGAVVSGQRYFGYWTLSDTHAGS